MFCVKWEVHISIGKQIMVKKKRGSAGFFSIIMIYLIFFCLTGTF